MAAINRNPMTYFPETIDHPCDYIAAYPSAIAEAHATVDAAAFGRAATALQDAIARNATILTYGNGGSAE
jgi:hypothetical protein